MIKSSGRVERIDDFGRLVINVDDRQKFYNLKQQYPNFGSNRVSHISVKFGILPSNIPSYIGISSESSPKLAEDMIGSQVDFVIQMRKFGINWCFILRKIVEKKYVIHEL